MTICEHPRPVPVTLSTTEVVVTTICPDCFNFVAIEWPCADCSWIEDRRLCDPQPIMVLGRACERHRRERSS